MQVPLASLPRTVLGAALLVAASSCATVVTPSSRIVRSADGATVGVAAAADALAELDVVFLGEEHDSGEAHALQLALTRALLERRGEVAISMEMFERDAQRRLDLYLQGAVDEDFFLAGTRPWGNYADHYRPAIELAKAEGLDVIAANVYRPIASRVARQGPLAAKGDPWSAEHVDSTPAGAYYDRFVEAMGGVAGHGGPMIDRIYAAQAVKDDTMAESIARYLEERGADAPLVVHWCGKFHSDYGLGTVERLLARRPGLRVGVVSTISDIGGRALDEDERARGEFVFVVPRPAGRDAE